MRPPRQSVPARRGGAWRRPSMGSSGTGGRRGPDRGPDRGLPGFTGPLGRALGLLDRGEDSLGRLPPAGSPGCAGLAYGLECAVTGSVRGSRRLGGAVRAHMTFPSRLCRVPQWWASAATSCRPRPPSSKIWARRRCGRRPGWHRRQWSWWDWRRRPAVCRSSFGPGLLRRQRRRKQSRRGAGCTATWP